MREDFVFVALCGYSSNAGLKLIAKLFCCSRLKGKAIPLQAWTGPDGSRRFSLPDIKTIGT
jgi:hypothetical protein